MAKYLIAKVTLVNVRTHQSLMQYQMDLAMSANREYTILHSSNLVKSVETSVYTIILLRSVPAIWQLICSGMAKNVSYANILNIGTTLCLNALCAHSNKFMIYSIEIVNTVRLKIHTSMGNTAQYVLTIYTIILHRIRVCNAKMDRFTITL